MPRQARIHSKTRIYHIMLRGNERKNIFGSADDKNRFISKLFQKKQDGEYLLYAYCVMDNHVHLLIKEGTESIAKSIKKLSVSYAYYYNKKYKRVGHVFLDRYQSENIENKLHLRGAIRFIHNNPLAAGVELVEAYRWSSYRYYTESNILLPEVNEILALFSTVRQNAIEQFVEFSRSESEDQFLEMEEVAEPDLGRENIEQYLKEFMAANGVDKTELLRNKELTASLIHELKTKTDLSLRQIAVFTGINREKVRRLSGETAPRQAAGELEAGS